eukprot:TRINITY_DN7891_c0_g1_i1.p1 TRINITY_DN7891_c0_g1~~TRINITY_DN7891_c0_g1_i1.p1  ORF type:complete len:365 (-),score=100.02 TRINITY_DN7891_c0_g1_i1:270-1364(-)
MAKVVKRFFGKKADSEEKKKSDAINKLLKETGESLEFKVLLLGSGESGKSTVLKQLKNIMKVKLEETELRQIATSIHSNAFTCMKTLLEAAERLSIPIEGEEDQERAKKILAIETFEYPLSMQMAEDIVTLWKNPSIKAVYDRRSEFWNLDSTPYYIQHALRFAEDDYSPSEEDIIMARVRTTGIVVTEFDEPPIHFRVVDVAGQRGERKKWIHCFDDSKAVIFLVNLAGYNQRMFEDPEKNQMHDSLELFQSVVNNPMFKDTPIFLFLNKKDLFEEMIRTTDLKVCFPHYTGGGSDVTAALEFLTNEFHSKMADQTKTLNVSYIAARFKKDIKYSWEELKEVLIEHNRREIEKANKKLAKKKK